MEIDVAMNKIKDNDFDVGVHNVLNKRSADRGLSSPFKQEVQELQELVRQSHQRHRVLRCVGLRSTLLVSH